MSILLFAAAGLFFLVGIVALVVALAVPKMRLAAAIVAGMGLLMSACVVGFFVLAVSQM